MIGLEWVLRLAGALFAVVAVQSAADATNPRRARNAAFWGAYAVSLLFGPSLPDFVQGCLVIVMVVVGGVAGLGRGEPRTSSPAERAEGARRFRNRLFLPALLVPGLTLVLSLSLRYVEVGSAPLVDPKNASLFALAFSAIVAVVVATWLLRQPAAAPARECRRLLDLVGWAAVLPQMLAALGAVFAAASVGDHVAALSGRFVPLAARWAAVSAYTVGMAIFTMLMGNAFAAFPVMTAAIGLPVLVRKFGGDPAGVAAIGMLSGFCGTLMTPMAANFNIVPAALLELPEKGAVVRVQVPTALLVLLVNTVLMYLFVFRA